MTATTSRGRSIIVPDFTSWKAADALHELSELGLIGQPVLEPVDDVAEAGFVIGQEPVPGQPCRKSTFVLLTVGSHPDFDPRSFADTVAAAAPVQPSLYAPHTAPSFRADDAPGALAPEPAAAAVETPSPAEQPAGLAGHIDVAPAERFGPQYDDEPNWSDDRFAGPTVEDEAAFYNEEVPLPHDQEVPLPGDQDADYHSAGAEWARLRGDHDSTFGWGDADEADEDPQATGQAFFEREEVADGEIADEQPFVAPAKPKRRRRRYRRLTSRQKLTAAGVLVALVFVGLLATSSPKKGSPKGSSHKATVATHTPVRKRTVPKVIPTRTVTVTVTTPVKTKVRHHKRAHHKHVAAKAPAHTTTSSVQTTSVSSYTPPVTSHYTAPPATQHVASTPTTTSSPASTTSSAGRSAAHSSGTGSGSALQSPTGAVAPPTPTQP